MCGRYVIASTVKVIEKKFKVKAAPEINFEPNYNVTVGNLAPIITTENPTEIQLAEFGFTPDWADKKKYILNARSEGDHNPDNRSDYTGAKGIFLKPYFKKSIRFKRCVVLADAFIEGPTKEKLNQPYLVYLINKKRPFAMAGIYDDWIDKSTGEITRSFAILTCPPNELMHKIHHHRMPVILNDADVDHYLNKTTSQHEIGDLLRSYDYKLMNAYRISPEIKRPNLNEKELINPIEEPVQKEYYFEQKQTIKLVGMGMTSSREQRLKEEEEG